MILPNFHPIGTEKAGIGAGAFLSNSWPKGAEIEPELASRAATLGNRLNFDCAHGAACAG
jgi:hypothetical protein